ncbi:hypothetical protein Avbf_17299 [Armadillidium vulgare]|nr:hypothetical protein Avbf_17299 [Armadillidium vulgare]
MLLDNYTTYYKIRTKSNFTMPFIMKQGSNKFNAFSEGSPFTFEVFCSGYVRKDILKYNNSIFTTIVLHNTGDTDFYIQIDNLASNQCSNIPPKSILIQFKVKIHSGDILT